MQVIVVPGEKHEEGPKELFEEIMGQSFPTWYKI